MTTTADTAQGLKRDYLWNTAASLMSSGAMVIMLMVSSRSLGVAAAGLFTLAISVGQQFQTVGMYEVRTFHVTDVNRQFSFGVYAATRVLTIGVMLGCIVVYAFIVGDDAKSVLTMGLVAALRTFDAAEDVFYAEFQRRSRLATVGRACFLRILSTTLVFSVLLVVTSDLLLSTAVTCAVSVIVFVAVYLPPTRQVFSPRPTWARHDIERLLIECFPLFLASFLAMFLANAPRYAIARYLTHADQGYFAIIYMPAVAINMLALLVFRPLLTPLATRWVQQDVAGFRKIIQRGLATTALSFVAVAVVTAVAGAPILGLVFGADVSGYKLELIVLVLGGAAYSTMTIVYYALTTMRRQSLVFVGYLLASGVVVVLAVILVPMAGMMGACLSYSLTMLLLTVFFAVPVFTDGSPDESHTRQEVTPR